ncbi:hypothetical protein BS47DRAFT_1305518, partial [Hydnum rufescens UP504]
SAHPKIARIICEWLQQFCTAGVPISCIVIKLQILGTIRSHAPELLEDQKFKCSDTYIRKFLHTHLHWSMHTSTHATQKTPANWLGLCEDMFMWLAYYIKMFDVPTELVINVDQTGVCLIPAGNKTWVPMGSKQVNTFGKEEK